MWLWEGVGQPEEGVEAVEVALCVEDGENGQQRKTRDHAAGVSGLGQSSDGRANGLVIY